MDVDVTSVSRKAEHLGQTAAAVTVITGEEVERNIYGRVSLRF